jgi:hypothetical protein
MTDTGWNRSAAPPPAGYEVEERVTPARRGLRVFQILAAAAGAVLFVVGLVAVFRVDFGAGFFDTSGSVAGFGFSPALALVAILLGGATMAATLADQDRGSAAVVGLLTILAGIGALVLEGQRVADANVDRRAAGLFIAIGAVVFVLSLVPWWSGRRRSTVVRA